MKDSILARAMILVGSCSILLKHEMLRFETDPQNENRYTFSYKGVTLEVISNRDTITAVYIDPVSDKNLTKEISRAGLLGSFALKDFLIGFFNQSLNLHLYERLTDFGIYGFEITGVSRVETIDAERLLVHVTVNDAYGDKKKIKDLEVDFDSQEGQLMVLLLISQGCVDSMVIDFAQATSSSPVYTLDHKQGLHSALAGVLAQIVSKRMLKLDPTVD